MKLSYNDEKHAYWLDGKRCKGVTSVAKIPDDTYNIDQWRDRQIVIGMASSAPLVHRAAAHFDERDKIQSIAEEAKVLAKAHEASGRGIADHRLTERFDLGLEFIDSPQAQATRKAWATALDHAGIEIVPEWIERIIVYPDLLIAGRYDRIGRYKATGRPVGLDVKTGENAIKYPHSTVLQLGLYFNAPLMAGPLNPGKNGTEWTETFEPLPDDLHRDHAIVVYLPPEGSARCYRVNIAAGWEAAQTICFPTLTWRKTGGLVEEITSLEPALAESLPRTQQEYADLLDRTEWVRDRVEAIKAAGHGNDLAALWTLHPEIPTFPKGGPHTIYEVTVVAEMCDRIEAQHGLPFGPPDPTQPTATKRTRNST